MSRTARILFVGEEGARVDRVSDRIERRSDDLSVETARPERALEAVSSEGIDCLLAEYAMDGVDGLELLARVRERRPEVPVVLFPREGDERVVSEALARNAADYVPHVPDDPGCYDRLVSTLEAAVGASAADADPGRDSDSGTATPCVRDPSDGSGREERLATLHEATRDLMAAASRTEIGEITVETVKHVLDLPMTSVYVRDDDRLRPIANTEEVREVLGSVPPLERGDALA